MAPSGSMSLGGVVCLVLLSNLASPAGAHTTLYGFDEPIVQLTADNFTLITSTENAWLVEFYATWCGHCRRFAPTFSELARDIQAWHKVIRVAAIACSNPENTALCRFYQIWGYPTVKFYPPYAGHHNGFLHHGDKTVQSLRAATIYFLDDTLVAPPGSWPNLKPLQQLGEIWDNTNDQVKIAFVIFEDANSTESERFLGRELILDFSSRNIIVARMTDSEIIGQPDLPTPSLYQVNRDGTISFLASNQSREGFGTIIHNAILESTGLTTVATSLTQAITTQKPNISKPDGIHMQDLESTVYYSLWVEVALHPNITGDALSALKGYISVLTRYFPGELYHEGFLRRLLDWLDVTPSLTGARWQHMINTFRECGATCDDSYNLTWVGCKGSHPGFRGYPCGLWTLFHTLTVQAYNDKHSNGGSFVPAEVPIAMREYVRHFLGCRECATHFHNMAALLPEDVAIGPDGVLWLWGAHNKVNRRLAGDPTEDSAHPKIQFPSLVDCPLCRIPTLGVSGNNSSIEWDLDQVLAYLLKFYGSENIIQDTQLHNFFTNMLITTEEPFSTTAPTHVTPTCSPLNTNWGPCSRTCGPGVSMRMTNNNPKCRLETETRLCMVKICPKGKSKQRRCTSNPKGSRGQVIRLGRCRTSRRVPVCNTCRDKCCNATRHHTVWLKTVCETSKKDRLLRHRGYSKVMWIDECKCNERCPDTD